MFILNKLSHEEHLIVQNQTDKDQVKIKSSLVGRLALDYMYTPRHNQTSNVLVLDRASSTGNQDPIGGEHAEPYARVNLESTGYSSNTYIHVDHAEVEISRARATQKKIKLQVTLYMANSRKK